MEFTSLRNKVSDSKKCKTSLAKEKEVVWRKLTTKAPRTYKHT
jgi:hypothetical protein